jgi:hypothetical protein
VHILGWLRHAIQLQKKSDAPARIFQQRELKLQQRQVDYAGSNDLGKSSVSAIILFPPPPIRILWQGFQFQNIALTPKREAFFVLWTQHVNQVLSAINSQSSFSKSSGNHVSFCVVIFCVFPPKYTIPHHRMFGSSMGDVTVLVCVQVGDAISGGQLAITVPSDIYVTAFKKKVQEEYEMFYGKKILGGSMTVS